MLGAFQHRAMIRTVLVRTSRLGWSAWPDGHAHEHRGVLAVDRLGLLQHGLVHPGLDGVTDDGVSERLTGLRRLRGPGVDAVDDRLDAGLAGADLDGDVSGAPAVVLGLDEHALVAGDQFTVLHLLAFVAVDARLVDLVARRAVGGRGERRTRPRLGREGRGRGRDVVVHEHGAADAEHQAQQGRDDQRDGAVTLRLRPGGRLGAGGARGRRGHGGGLGAERVGGRLDAGGVRGRRGVAERAGILSGHVAAFLLSMCG